MNKKILVLAMVILVALVLVIALYGFYEEQVEPEPSEMKTTLALPDTAAPPVPGPEKVLDQAAPEPEQTSVDTEAPDPVEAVAPLPSLRESDEELKREFSSWDRGDALLALLVSDELVRKFVRAVSALSEGTVVQEFRPVRSPKGRFMVQDRGIASGKDYRAYGISSDNYARYAPYFSVLEAISPERAGRLYRRYLPLFEDAYAELGYPRQNFHTTMQRALTQLLKIPLKVDDPELKQPSVMYVFSEASIEAASGVDKLKWRIGPEYSAQLIAWAREFNQVIAK